jgi:VIT family
MLLAIGASLSQGSRIDSVGHDHPRPIGRDGHGPRRASRSARLAARPSPVGSRSSRGPKSRTMGSSRPPTYSRGSHGAGASNRTLITAATTATIAGMLAVGGAEWAEAAAEREAQLRAADEEAAEIARQPGVEHVELVAHYEAKGLTPQLAREVADQLMAHDPVDAHLASEHGILEIMSRAETVRAGIGSAIGYLLGAAIPLISTVVVPVAAESLVILAAVCSP